MIWAWAFSGLRFHGTRSLLTILAIALPTALICSAACFREGYEASLKRDIDAMGYQVLVTGKGCPHEAATLILRGGSIPMYIQDPVYRHIVGQPEVQDATGFLLQALPVPERNTNQVVMGVDRNFLNLKPGFQLQRGSWFTADARDEAVLGFNVAEHLRLNIGDDLTMDGNRVTVRGVLDKLGAQDDGTIFLPLKTAQRIFSKRDRLTGVGIRVKDIDLAGDLIERLYDVPSIQIVRMAQVQGMMLNILKGVHGVIMVFSTMCLFIALLGVFNASLASVSERTHEMGLLRALGCPTGILFILVLSEALLIGLAGCCGGWGLTVLLRGAFEWFMRYNLAYVPSGEVMPLSLAIMLPGGGAAVISCLLAGLYPAWKASRVTPMTSIRGYTS